MPHRWGGRSTRADGTHDTDHQIFPASFPCNVRRAGGEENEIGSRDIARNVPTVQCRSTWITQAPMKWLSIRDGLDRMMECCTMRSRLLT